MIHIDGWKRAQQSHVGNGGFRCPCCGPRTRKDKRRLAKLARAALKRELQKSE